VVIQENRTPDNLFQDSVLKANGGDIVSPQTGGKCWTQQYGEQTVQLAPLSVANCTDPGHGHGSWENQYHNGAIDGACNHPTTTACPKNQIQYPCPFDLTKKTDCSQYTYVENTQSDPVVQPYWDIAEKYGFANYFFQTNQGPSLPAHQFLFAGTSVPVYPSDTHYHAKGGVNYYYHDDFVAENPSDSNQNDKIPGDDTGCIAPLFHPVHPLDRSGPTDRLHPSVPV